MSHRMARDATLYALLPKIDEDLAETGRAAGCDCGGVLHRSDFARKPRGGPGGLGPEWDERISFCCDREGCRRRMTPPSVRFLGRRVFLGAFVVLAAAMLNGPTPRRVSELRDLLGVSERTLRRWAAWWRTAFVESPFWKAAAGQFAPPPPTAAELPRSLLDRFGFGGDGRDRVVDALRFLAPITTTTARFDMPA